MLGPHDRKSFECRRQERVCLLTTGYDQPMLTDHASRYSEVRESGGH